MVWGVRSHLNRFEILILFYILHDCINEVSDWNEIFHWIAWEFKIVNDVMSGIVLIVPYMCERAFLVLIGLLQYWFLTRWQHNILFNYNQVIDIELNALKCIMKCYLNIWLLIMWKFTPTHPHPWPHPPIPPTHTHTHTHILEIA